MSATSSTDTDAVFWTRRRNSRALISLPNRYMHSPVEVINLMDLEQYQNSWQGFQRALRKTKPLKLNLTLKICSTFALELPQLL